jgi:hypothetical protein
VVATNPHRNRQGWSRERSLEDHRPRQARAPAAGHGVDRAIADAGGVFVVLVDRVRHRRIPEPVAGRHSQGRDGSSAAGTGCRAARAKSCTSREWARPHGRACHGCCAGFRSCRGARACERRGRASAPAGRIRPGGGRLPVGIPRRHSHGQGRFALIVTPHREREASPGRERPNRTAEKEADPAGFPGGQLV